MLYPVACIDYQDLWQTRTGSQKPGSGPGVTLNPLINPPQAHVCHEIQGPHGAPAETAAESLSASSGGSVDLTCIPPALSTDALAARDNQAGAHVRGRDRDGQDQQSGVPVSCLRLTGLGSLHTR